MSSDGALAARVSSFAGTIATLDSPFPRRFWLTRATFFFHQASLQPSQATSVLGDRVRLINKVNADIADWLQVRSRSRSLHAQRGARSNLD